MSGSSTGDLSFNVQTPCPSHTLVVQARPLARKDPRWRVQVFLKARVQRWGRIRLCAKVRRVSPSVATQSSELTTATKAESSSNQVASTEVIQKIKASPDSTATHASSVSSSGNADSVRRPASADSCSLRKTKTTTNTAEDSSIVGAFIGELKSRLSWTKMATVLKAESFVLASNSGCRPSDKDNANGEEKSELQQPAPTTESRRPLAPIQNRPANGVFVGTQASDSAKDMHLHHPTSTDAFPSSDDNDGCNPPGANFTVAELVTTVFGTRVSSRS
ncbi:hypothetical protein B0H14DRAFT_3641960 [Mycena olivaceomarginata]|nr:hypothetical protein B0H14DRAFT_3641960 [Mycena olivaceomarginata]